MSRAAIALLTFLSACFLGVWSPASAQKVEFKDGSKCNVALQNSPFSNTVIYCDASNRLTYTITYYELHGMVAALFAQGLVHPALDVPIGATPIVVQNDVLQFSKRFVEQYGQPLELLDPTEIGLNDTTFLASEQEANKLEARIKARRTVPKVFLNPTVHSYTNFFLLSDRLTPQATKEVLSSLHFKLAGPETIDPQYGLRLTSPGAWPNLTPQILPNALTCDLSGNAGRSVQTIGAVPWRSGTLHDVANYSRIIRENFGAWISPFLLGRLALPKSAHEQLDSLLESSGNGRKAYASERKISEEEAYERYSSEPEDGPMHRRVRELEAEAQSRLARWITSFDYSQSGLLRGLSQLMRNNSPAGFLPVIYDQGGPCGGAYAYPIALAMPRDIQLLVAVIENTSPRTQQLSSIAGRTWETDQLVLPAYSTAQMRRQEPTMLPLPPITLPSGGRLVIPMRFQLSHGRRLEELTMFTADADHGRALDSLRQWMRRGGARICVPYIESDLDNLRFNDIGQVTERQLSLPVTQGLPRVFETGPMVDVTSITANGELFNTRPFDSNRLAAYGVFMGGSCPFLSSYSGEPDLWRNLGEVLVGANSGEKSRVETRALPNFKGKLRLSEREDEVAVIKKLRVRASLKSGETRELKIMVQMSGNALQQGDTFFLARGGSLTIDVPGYSEFEPSELDGFFAEIEGYYVPLAAAFAERPN